MTSGICPGLLVAFFMFTLYNKSHTINKLQILFSGDIRITTVQILFNGDVRITKVQNLLVEMSKLVKTTTVQNLLVEMSELPTISEHILPTFLLFFSYFLG